MVTDHSRTSVDAASNLFHSRVAPMDGCGVSVPVGVHAAVGGLHDAPTPGDILCAPLAACQDSAVRMVAKILGVQLTALEVRVTATANVRGAMAMDPSVPVGIQAITREVRLSAAPGASPELLHKLTMAAEQCCVVQQTLKAPTGDKDDIPHLTCMASRREIPARR